MQKSGKGKSETATLLESQRGQESPQAPDGGCYVYKGLAPYNPSIRIIKGSESLIEEILRIQSFRADLTAFSSTNDNLYIRKDNQGLREPKIENRTKKGAALNSTTPPKQ